MTPWSSLRLGDLNRSTLEFRISKSLYTASLVSDSVAIEIGFTPHDDEFNSLLWSVRFNQFGSDEVTIRISDYMFGRTGLADLRSLEKLLDNNQDEEFRFRSARAEMKIYLGNWGIRTGFIVETIFYPEEYMPWPDREDLTTYLISRGDQSPITQYQFAFECNFEPLDQFYREMRIAFTKLNET